MSLLCDYFSPTTPGAASFDEDLTTAVRLGTLAGLVTEAELGAVGTGGQIFDDLDSTLGHAGDGIVGLKQMFFTETAAPGGNQRLWTGYIADRKYHRGDDSLILGAARKIDATLLDVNSFLSFRVFAPTADDPTSDFDRPAETDIERIDALLTDVDFLSTTLFDIGYVNTGSPVALDANDYTGSRPQDVLSDCASMSGKNFFVMYDEATNQLVLWYDFWYSDGTDTIPFDSTIRLTNVNSEVGTTTFAIDPGATETLDPSRVVSAVYLPYDGGTAYRTLPATANTFAWRDMVAPSVTVKTLAKANALADRILIENSTEDPRISLTVKIPNTQVTLVKPGMRIQLHATHLPLVNGDFTWCRILQMTIRQDVLTEEFYWLDLELSPTPGLTCSTQVSVIQLSDSGTSGYDPPPISVAVAAPSERPSVLMAFAVLQNPFNDTPPFSFVGPDWTLVDGYLPPISPSITATMSGIAQSILPSGSPTACSITWTHPFDPNAIGRILGFSIASAATAPVQIASQLVTGGSVTLPSAPTAGNLLVLFAVYEDPGGNAPDITTLLGADGWVQISAVNLTTDEPTVHLGMSVGVKCVAEGDYPDGEVITGNPAYSHWAFIQEWSFT